MFDVAIVGFGPVGAIAANLLGRSGISTAVIDRTDQIFDKPRAIAFDHEVMRVFQNIGVADLIRDYIGAYVATEFLGSDGRPIARFMSKPGPARLGWQPNYVFNQPEVDRVVRDKAASLPSLTFYLSHKVLDVRQSLEAPFASISVRTGSSVNQTIEARYVIACDGANSILRKMLDVTLASLEFDRPFLVVDALVHEPALSRLPRVNVQHCNPSRPATYIVGPGSHRRWEIMLLDGESPESVNRTEVIASLLSAWLRPSEASILRASTYSFHALYARTLREGRVFLAGDAAHQTPPFMGQGMAQGVRDVANLIWKLERVVRGSAADRLLDTYRDERLAHVIKTTERAVTLGGVICELDPTRAAERDAAMRATNGDPPKTQYRQDLIPPLESGFALPQVAEVSGELAPQPWISADDGARVLLDDVSGTDFRVIATERFAASATKEGLRALKAMGISLVLLGTRETKVDPGFARVVHEEDGSLETWLHRVGCGAILVRPDHYIYAGLSGWTDLEAVLDQLQRYWGACPDRIRSPSASPSVAGESLT